MELILTFWYVNLNNEPAEQKWPWPSRSRVKLIVQTHPNQDISLTISLRELFWHVLQHKQLCGTNVVLTFNFKVLKSANLAKYWSLKVVIIFTISCTLLWVVDLYMYTNIFNHGKQFVTLTFKVIMQTHLNHAVSQTIG